MKRNALLLIAFVSLTSCAIFSKERQELSNLCFLPLPELVLPDGETDESWLLEAFLLQHDHIENLKKNRESDIACAVKLYNLRD